MVGGVLAARCSLAQQHERECVAGMDSTIDEQWSESGRPAGSPDTEECLQWMEAAVATSSAHHPSLDVDTWGL